MTQTSNYKLYNQNKSLRFFSEDLQKRGQNVLQSGGHLENIMLIPYNKLIISEMKLRVLNNRCSAHKRKHNRW